MDIIRGMMIGVIMDTEITILITGAIILTHHIGMAVAEVITPQPILKKEHFPKDPALLEIHQEVEL